MSARRARATLDQLIFLDANVLFSAAWRVDSGRRRIWALPSSIVRCTNGYAMIEADRNLSDAAARERLHLLMTRVRLVPSVTLGELPPGVALPEKDRPILLSALSAGCSHLLTGDRAHFGPYFDTVVGGVHILRPAEYLAQVEAD